MVNFEACRSKFSLIIPTIFYRHSSAASQGTGRFEALEKKPDMTKSENSRVLMYIYFSFPVFLSPHFLEKKECEFSYCVKRQPGGISSYSFCWHNAAVISTHCPAKQAWPFQGHLLWKKGTNLIFHSPPQNASFCSQSFQGGWQYWFLPYGHILYVKTTTFVPALPLNASDGDNWCTSGHILSNYLQCSVAAVKYYNRLFQYRCYVLTQSTVWKDQITC